MSDGIYISGVTVDEDSADLTFRDIERLKWEKACEGCPCRCGSYCNVAMGSFCEMGDCPFAYWTKYGGF